jgi:hypothetical protein
VCAGTRMGVCMQIGKRRGLPIGGENEGKRGNVT